MGICTSKPSTESNVSGNDEIAIPDKDNANPVKDVAKPADNAETLENQQKKLAEAEAGKRSPVFPFYSPSPAHYFFSKKSPARSPANATPRRFFKRPFPPPSPAKHIRAVLARRHGSVKPNEAAIP